MCYLCANWTRWRRTRYLTDPSNGNIGLILIFLLGSPSDFLAIWRNSQLWSDSGPADWRFVAIRIHWVWKARTVRGRVFEDGQCADWRQTHSCGLQPVGRQELPVEARMYVEEGEGNRPKKLGGVCSVNMGREFTLQNQRVRRGRIFKIWTFLKNACLRPFFRFETRDLIGD